MLNPHYRVTADLLANIKRISELVVTLNNRRFPDVVLVEFEKSAREVSTFASTSIEGNPLPLTEVKKVLKSAPAHLRDSEKEVLNYNQALRELNKKIESKKARLSLDLILGIQKQVTLGLLNADNSEHFRKEPVAVNDPRTGNVVFLPPDAKDVEPLMRELVDYVNENKGKTDPLILAGIFHKQMVIIHPFMDGNGRTARLATKILLAEMGLNTFDLFSFENYYNRNVTRYFQKVGEYGNYYELADKIDFTPWLEYFTEGIVDELLRVQKLLSQAPPVLGSHLQPHHEKILEFIKEKGFITARDYAGLVDRAKATRILDFKKLIGLGLISRKGRGRATYYTLKD